MAFFADLGEFLAFLDFFASTGDLCYLYYVFALVVL